MNGKMILTLNEKLSQALKHKFQNSDDPYMEYPINKFNAFLIEEIEEDGEFIYEFHYSRKGKDFDKDQVELENFVIELLSYVNCMWEYD